MFATFPHIISHSYVKCGQKGLFNPPASPPGITFHSIFFYCVSFIIPTVFIKRKECGPSSAHIPLTNRRNSNPACATHFHHTSWKLWFLIVFCCCCCTLAAVRRCTAGVTNLAALSASSKLQRLSDHLWGFSCDVSQCGFISFVVIAGLTLVVITLGCFLQLRLVKHIALWLSLDVGLILQLLHPQMGCAENGTQHVAYRALLHGTGDGA